MWNESERSLQRDFEFKDFKQAFAFMTAVAEVADHMDHHPQWSNIYNKVSIALSTHDAGDIVTDKDRMLQKEIDGIFEDISSEE